jgi:hypothetical protein
MNLVAITLVGVCGLVLMLSAMVFRVQFPDYERSDIDPT